MKSRMYDCNICVSRLALIIPLLLGIMNSGFAGRKTDKHEKYLANSAAHLGTDMLAKDQSDAKGLSLIKAALKLNPDNERALLTTMILKKALTLETAPHKFTVDDFAKKTIYRGTYLYDKKLESYSGTPTLAKLYFLLAELFKPTDKTVLVYLGRLEQAGERQTLKAILNTDETVEDWLSAKEEDEQKETTKESVHFWGIGESPAALKTLYGRSTRTKYAQRSNGTLKYYRTNTGGQVEAFITGGKCVRIQYSLPIREYPTGADQDAHVLTGRPGWKLVLERASVRGFENADKTMAASITSTGTTLAFVVWDKTFYK